MGGGGSLDLGTDPEKESIWDACVAQRLFTDTPKELLL